MIEIIEEIIEGLGYKLVYYNMVKLKEKCKVVIDIHKPDGGLSFEDCKVVYKNCESFLIEKFGEDLILEVSSPGVNRILKTERELKVFIGNKIEIYFDNSFLENFDFPIKNGDVYLLNDYKDGFIYITPIESNKDTSTNLSNGEKQLIIEKVNVDNINKIKLMD